MSEAKSTLWHRWDIVDTFRRPRRAIALVLAVVLQLLVLDGLISLALRGHPEDFESQPADEEDVRQLLRAAALEKGDVWLLLGDSVLAGDVMEGRVENWQAHRVMDYMRQEKEPSRQERFFQIALNGLLPVDILQIVRELDRQDPHQRISLLIELNPRYFSPYYREQTACTRGWLDHLAPRMITEGQLDRLHWAAQQFRLCGDWFSRTLPVYRHRKRLGLTQWAALEEDLVIPAEPPFVPGRLEGMARISMHYQDMDLSERSAQGRALDEVLHRLRTTHRRAMFFTTPLNRDFMRQAAKDEKYGAYIAALSGKIHSPRHPHLSVVHLDHPLFEPSLFLDHCHLFPEGNRLLAINLLHEMNISLAKVPARTEIVYPEGGDRTLVWNDKTGSSEGAAWQALFQQPQGMALGSRGELVIADTQNHCLRILDGNQQAVRLLAGFPEEPGSADGAALEARLNAPGALCFLGETLFFADDEGRLLRRLENGMVLTEYTLSGPRWEAVSVIRQYEGNLYLLDREERILEYQPVERRVRTTIESQSDTGIIAFDIAPDGRLFLADRESRIWQGQVENTASLGESSEGLQLFFENTGKSILPEGERDFYPLNFDEVRLSRIVDLHYLQRYDGLLVLNEEPAKVVRPRIPVPTERMHLLFFGCHDRLMYPWIKLQISEDFFTMLNETSESLVSQYHEGVLAVHQPTASVYYLEQARSRLYHIGDGLWELARLSTIQPPYGWRCGDYVVANLSPQRHLADRLERLQREGPYVAMLLGSSLTTTSDILRKYSMGRVLEMELWDILGYRDSIRMDLLCRGVPALSLLEALDAFETYLSNGGRVDVLLLELWSEQSLYGSEPGVPDLLTEDRMMDFLNRLSLAAARFDTRVIFFDNTGMRSLRSEGLRRAPEEVERFCRVARQAGFEVLELTDRLIRDHLDWAPWGSPPYLWQHASPWAIDVTSRLLASRLHPLLREHLKGRTPAIDRIEMEVRPVPPEFQLVQAFQAISAPWEKLDRYSVDLIALQRVFVDGHLSLFVDVAKVDAYEDEDHPDLLERVALGIFNQVLRREVAGSRVTRITLTLATFDNYDEYGEGVRESATILWERSMQREDFERYLRTTGQRILGQL